jgi:hypothetical protein
MLADNGDNFSIVLNSQATGQNIQKINNMGYMKYTNSINSLLPQNSVNKKYKISVNFVSVVCPQTTLAGENLYILEFATGNNIKNLYVNGSSSTMTNSVMIPLEPWPSVMSASALVSTYWTCKTAFTGRFPSDTFEVRIRNASNFAITSAFPDYVLQATFEEILETQVF